MTIQSVKTVSKAASDVLPLWIDWAPWLAKEAAQLGLSVSIASSAWSSTDVSVDSDPAPAVAGAVASCWVSGGTPPLGRQVVNTITTNRGHVVSRAIIVNVR